MAKGLWPLFCMGNFTKPKTKKQKQKVEKSSRVLSIAIFQLRELYSTMVHTNIGSSTLEPGWSEDHLDVEKKNYYYI